MMIGVCVASRCRITFRQSQNAKKLPRECPLRWLTTNETVPAPGVNPKVSPKWHCFLAEVSVLATYEESVVNP